MRICRNVHSSFFRFLSARLRISLTRKARMEVQVIASGCTLYMNMEHDKRRSSATPTCKLSILEEGRYTLNIPHSSRNMRTTLNILHNGTKTEYKVSIPHTIDRKLRGRGWRGLSVVAQSDPKSRVKAYDLLVCLASESIGLMIG